MLELKLAQAPRWVRHHLEGAVEVWEVPSILAGDPVLIHADAVLLDVAKSRAAFARATAERCADGTQPDDIEKELLRLYEEARKAHPETDAEADDAEGRPASQATRLVRLLSEPGTEFFHTPAGEPYITVDDHGHRVTFSLAERAAGFRQWAVRKFYREEGTVPNAGALAGALAVLQAKAQFEGPEQAVHLRIAGDATHTWIDLGDETWEAIEVTAQGWRVVTQPPVKFRRPPGLLPLPRPIRGGTLDDLRPFLDFGPGDEAEGQLRRFLAFVLDCFRPSGPYGVLTIYGPEGSGKSTVSRIVRALVDPAQQPLLRPPRDERNLHVRAHNAAVVTLSNLSALPDWLSDAICSLTSGEGQSERRLYADAEAYTFDVCRPVILNGVEELGTRRDLLDRQTPLRQPHFKETRTPRQQERAFWRAFDQAHPKLLGLLLDAVAAGLAAGEDVELGPLPRLADTSHWAARCLQHFGYEPATVLGDFHADSASRHSRVLDGSPLVEPLLAFVQARPDHSWTGLMSELLHALNDARGTARAPKGWPQNAIRLSGHIQRIQTALGAVGLQVDLPKRTKRGQPITLRWEPPREEDPPPGGQPPAPVPASEAACSLSIPSSPPCGTNAGAGWADVDSARPNYTEADGPSRPAGGVEAGGDDSGLIYTADDAKLGAGTGHADRGVDGVDAPPSTLKGGTAALPEPSPVRRTLGPGP